MGATVRLLSSNVARNYTCTFYIENISFIGVMYLGTLYINYQISLQTGNQTFNINNQYIIVGKTLFNNDIAKEIGKTIGIHMVVYMDKKIAATSK